MKGPTHYNADFDGIAPFYDWLASVMFGKKLQRAQTAFLADIPEKASVLLVGGGTGWLLEQILVHCKPSRVLYLEASASMIALASERITRKSLLGTVEFKVDDQISLPPDERFDVIITPFLLDLFTEQTLRSRIIPPLLNALPASGRWLATDFVRTHVWWQRALLWLMIHFFRFTATIEITQLADWQRLLSEAGLSPQKRQSHVSGMVAAGVWTRPM